MQSLQSLKAAHQDGACGHGWTAGMEAQMGGGEGRRANCPRLPPCCVLLHAQVATLVAENIFMIDTKFWIRVATRNDTAASQGEAGPLGLVALPPSPPLDPTPH